MTLAKTIEQYLPLDQPHIHRLLAMDGASTDLAQVLAEIEILAPLQLPPSGEKNRIVLATSDHFQLVLMLWGAHTISPIHGHAGLDCHMKVLCGEIVEIRYRPNSLEIQSTHTHQLNEVSFIHDNNSFHSLATPGDAAATLHLYSGPLDVMQIFNEESRQWESRLSDP